MDWADLVEKFAVAHRSYQSSQSVETVTKRLAEGASLAGAYYPKMLGYKLDGSRIRLRFQGIVSEEPDGPGPSSRDFVGEIRPLGQGCVIVGAFRWPILYLVILTGLSSMLPLAVLLQHWKTGAPLGWGPLLWGLGFAALLHFFIVKVGARGEWEMEKFLDEITAD